MFLFYFSNFAVVCFDRCVLVLLLSHFIFRIFGLHLDYGLVRYDFMGVAGYSRELKVCAEPPVDVSSLDWCMLLVTTLSHRCLNHLR
jgi:hypothetical protein